MDRLPDAVVGQLRCAGAGVVDLSVRNLAMSTAMAVHHRRSGDEAQQAGSERVSSRCIELLRLLEPAEVKERLEQLLAAALDTAVTTSPSWRNGRTTPSRNKPSETASMPWLRAKP